MALVGRTEISAVANSSSFPPKQRRISRYSNAEQPARAHANSIPPIPENSLQSGADTKWRIAHVGLAFEDTGEILTL